ncbi:hypothetical protein BpHYR1_015041 [Brachionus plicatilis]|uniref:Uncharacterized protein n=1 Tax=Brachionus plicatilis TaxID=10195 RepID=A0A3M7QJ83_BRAPC|nr:hypothetical protein BpHYR1_015041 [Brachionus plicatilis]
MLLIGILNDKILIFKHAQKHEFTQITEKKYKSFVLEALFALIQNYNGTSSVDIYISQYFV